MLSYIISARLPFIFVDRLWLMSWSILRVMQLLHQQITSHLISVVSSSRLALHIVLVVLAGFIWSYWCILVANNSNCVLLLVFTRHWSASSVAAWIINSNYVKEPLKPNSFHRILVSYLIVQHLISWRCISFHLSFVGYNAYWVQQKIFCTYCAWDEWRLFGFRCMAPTSEDENIFCSKAHPKFGLYGYHSMMHGQCKAASSWFWYSRPGTYVKLFSSRLKKHSVPPL
jgi:hypothetical protein